MREGVRREERRVGAERLERLGQLPRHPLRGRAMAPADQQARWNQTANEWRGHAPYLLLR